MTSNKSSHTTKILYIVIVAFSLIISFIFCVGKTGLHMDEMWTYSLSNTADSYSPPITSSWRTREDLLEHYTIQNENVYDFKMVFDNQADDVHPPLYYLIMHVISSIAFYANIGFSKWTGLSINFIFQILNFFFIYKICKHFPNGNALAIISGVLFGASFATLNMMVFIRMYLMLMSCVLATILIHLHLLEKQTFSAKDFTLLALTCCAGTLVQYYYLIYLFFICCFFGLFILLKKNIRLLFAWAGSILTGLTLSVLIFPSLISHLFFGVRGVQAQENATSFNWEDFIVKLRLFAHETWGFTGIVLCLLFIGMVVASKRMRTTVKKSGFLTEKMLLLTGSACAYVLVITHIMPYSALRYLCPAFAPFAIFFASMLILFYKNALAAGRQNKHIPKIALSCVAAFVMAAVGLSYVGETEDIRLPDIGHNIALLSNTPTVPAVVALQYPTNQNEMTPYIFASDTNYVFLGSNATHVQSLVDDPRELTACYLYLDYKLSEEAQENIISIMQNKIGSENCELLFWTVYSKVYYIA